MLDVDIVFTCSTSNKFFYQTFAQCGPNLVCSEKSRLALSQTQAYLFYKLQVFFRLFGANKLWPWNILPFYKLGNKTSEK